MITEKIIITTDISPAHPIRRVRIQVGNIFDYYASYDDTDDLPDVLRGVGIEIKNRLTRMAEAVR